MKTAKLLFLTALLAWPHAAAQAATAPRITGMILSPRSPDNVLVPRLTIQSDTGITNLVLYSSTLSGTNWTVLTNLLVTQSPYSVLDPQPPASAQQRFYRVQAQAPAAASRRGAGTGRGVCHGRSARKRRRGRTPTPYKLRERIRYGHQPGHPGALG